MRYKEGSNKQQTTLIPKCLDKYIPQDHICRIIHAFTQNLDMQKLEYKYAQTNTTGNKPYNPKIMLNLYIYDTYTAYAPAEDYKQKPQKT